MRVLDIPPFPRRFETPDLNDLIRTRLSQKIVLFPDQGIPLVCYTCWPNDEATRLAALGTIRGWAKDITDVPRRIPRIQHEWLRVADVLHKYSDLVAGGYQQRRGGPSIGKAIELVAANAKRAGTGAAKLWENWKKYKDAAHLVTAATLVAAEVRHRSRNQPFGEFGLGEDQLLPFQMVLLMPDLIIVVALAFEHLGLNNSPLGGTEPTFDPETLWRIPENINVASLDPPARKLTSDDIAILNARRAGNRGKANQRTT